MLDEEEEQYEFVEIHSLDKIGQKGEYLCTFCDETVSYCVWTSVQCNTQWNFCLNCQKDHFPEWPSEWDNLLNTTGSPFSSLSEQNHQEVFEWNRLWNANFSTSRVNNKEATYQCWWRWWIRSIQIAKCSYSTRSVKSCNRLNIANWNGKLTRSSQHKPNHQEEISPRICSAVVSATSFSVKKSTKNHSEPLNLSQNFKYCSSVDVEFEKFYVCALELYIYRRIKPLVYN